MKVNGINIKEKFNGDVVSFSPASMQIENNIVLMDSSYNVVLGEQQLKPQERTLVIDFYKEDDMSDFTSEISSSFILDIEDGYIYQCFTKETPNINQEGVQAYTYSLNVYVLKRKPLQTISFKGNKTIANIGNCVSEAIFKLSSTSAIAEFTINGITCELKANDPLVIDGIDKKVYYESSPDVSAFDSANIVVFPKLQKGANDITVSDTTVDVTISYYPTFM